MEKAISIAEGEGLTSSICRHITDKEKLADYINKFGTQKQEIKVAPLYIYLISILYLLFGIENFMLAINLFNLFLFISMLFILYWYLLHNYPNNKLLHIGTLLIFGINSMMLELSYGAHMETLSLFLFVIVFIYHLWIVANDNQAWYKLFFYSVTLTLLFLSKYSAIPFVGAFIIHFLFLKRYRQFLFISILVLIGTGFWFILRDIFMDGRVISSFGLFPFSNNAPKIIAIPSFFTLIYKLSLVIKLFLSMFIGFYGLAYLFLFAIVYLINYKSRNDVQLNFIILAVTIAFYFVLCFKPSFGALSDYRYLFPIVVFLIPFSFIELEKYISKIKRTMGRTIVYVLIGFFTFFHLIDIVKFTYNTKKKSIDRTSIFLAAEELIKEEKISNDKNILTNIIGYSVYADMGVVWAPGNISYENKVTLIDMYKIDYVLFCENQKNHLASWDQNVVPQDIFTDLQLICISKKDNRVKLYSTKKIEGMANEFLE